MDTLYSFVIRYTRKGYKGIWFESVKALNKLDAIIVAFEGETEIFGVYKITLIG